MTQQSNLPDLDNPRLCTPDDRITAQKLTNPLVELLLRLERIKRDKEHTIVAKAARQLLDDSIYVDELLHSRTPETYSANGEPFALSNFERKQFLKVADGELDFPQAVRAAEEQYRIGFLDKNSADRVQHLLTMAYSDAEEALRNAERDEYINAGGSDFDFDNKKKLHDFVLERVVGKLSNSLEKADLALDIYIDRLIEGRTANYDNVRSALDRLVREGFYIEILHVIHERYPIEASKIELSDQPTTTYDYRSPPTSHETNLSNFRHNHITKKIYLFDELEKLRCQHLVDEEAWQKAIDARAKAVAERKLSEDSEQRLADADAGKITFEGNLHPDGMYCFLGLRDIDQHAYNFSTHRGDPESPSCRGIAEEELKKESAPQWLCYCRSLWNIVVKTIWQDHGKCCAEYRNVFSDFDSFEIALFEATCIAKNDLLIANPIIRQLIRQLEESGYADNLLSKLLAEYPDKAKVAKITNPGKIEPRTVESSAAQKLLNVMRAQQKDRHPGQISPNDFGPLDVEGVATQVGQSAPTEQPEKETNINAPATIVEPHIENNAPPLCAEIDGGHHQQTANATKEREYEFRKHGSIWTIKYASESGNVPDLDGFKYMHYLVKRRVDGELKPITVTNLMATINSNVLNSEKMLTADETIDGNTGDFSGQHQISEKESLRKCREEIARIKKQPGWLDDPQLLAEVKDIEAEVRNSTFMKKSKSFQNNHDSNRVKVKQAIDRAIKMLRDNKMSGLANHLDQNITTGSNLQYNPTTLLEWQL